MNPTAKPTVRVVQMKKVLRKIAQAYDTIAQEYANAFTDEHAKKPKDQEILQRFANKIGDKKPVWDLGCGPGQTTKYLNDLGIAISGLDLSAKILDQAKALYPKIHFRQGNLLDLEFKNDSIAGIVAFYATVHFTEAHVGRAFCEIFRVLQPGGLFLSAYHLGKEPIHIDTFLGKKVDLPFVPLTTDFIFRCLTDQGFEKIEAIEREPYPDVEYESRRAYVFAVKPTS